MSIKNPLCLEDKRILVAGASSGIGRAIAIKLSELGASIVLSARSEETLKETLKMMSDSNHEIHPVDFNVLTPLDAYFDEITQNGRLKGLVYSVGICPIIPLQNITHKKMLDIFTTNYMSFMELTRLYAKKKYSCGGSIVAISSVSSLAGWSGASLYCGTKGALDSSIRALAIELQVKSIRINSVVPSLIRTKIYDLVSHSMNDDAEKEILRKQPLGVYRTIEMDVNGTDNP